MISYNVYKKNDELSEEYEKQPMKYLKGNYKIVALIGMVFCIGIITLLEEPFVHSLTGEEMNKNLIEYHGYGEIKDKIIIDKIIIDENSYGVDYYHPQIWINEQDYQKTKTFSVYIESKNHHNLFIDNQPVNEYNPSDMELASMGRYENYELLNYNVEENLDTYKLTETYENLSVIVKLYNEEGIEFEEYKVNLHNRLEKGKVYYYEDENISVHNLKIDKDFIIRSPDIHVNKVFNEAYELYISNSPEFSVGDNFYVPDTGAYLRFMPRNDSKLEEQLGHTLINGMPIYQYYPKPENNKYYLHITLPDEKHTLVKTLELKEK